MRACLLQGRGWKVRRNTGRGLAHGVCSRLHILYPQADKPVAVMSLCASFGD